MKKMLRSFLAALVVLTAVAHSDSFAQSSQPAMGAMGGDNMLSDAEKEAGWKLLFDGRTLLGWNPRGGSTQWNVEEGSITAVAVRGPGYIGTTAEFSDFHLKVDFWTDEGHNSGVFVRGHKDARVNQFSFYEINIADTHQSGFTTGSIVSNREDKKYEPAPTTAGKWNTMEIMAKGRDLSVTLNGHKGLELRDSTHSTGTVVLQAFGKGQVKFKNIKIMELK